MHRDPLPNNKKNQCLTSSFKLAKENSPDDHHCQSRYPLPDNERNQSEAFSFKLTKVTHRFLARVATLSLRMRLIKNRTFSFKLTKVNLQNFCQSRYPLPLPVNETDQGRYPLPENTELNSASN
jgi:hypothetical protein